MMRTDIYHSSLLYIGVAVIAAHIVLMLWAGLQMESKQHSSPRRRPMSVTTISLTPRAKEMSLPPSAPQFKTKSDPPIPMPTVDKVEATEPAPLTTEVKKKPLEQPVAKSAKQQPKKKAKKTKAASKPTPIAKKTELPKPDKRKVESAARKVERQSLLAKAQESIAKIQLKNDNNGAGKILKQQELKIPDMPVSASVSSAEAADMSVEEMCYRDELAGRLKLLLRLPEYGEVKIKLTVERSGRFVKLAVVGAESEANRNYLEDVLPTLSFPAFGTHFPGIAQHTFSITLSHEV